MNTVIPIQFSSPPLTGDSGECEKVQELPGDADQAGVQREPVPGHGHQRQGPGLLPARESLFCLSCGTFCLVCWLIKIKQVLFKLW